jgi:stage IV sporulation protein B
MDGLEHEPAKHLVKSGDYIIGWNDTQIARKSDLLDAVAAIESDEKITLTIRRDGEIVEAKVNPILSAAGEYKLGIWVRDNVQGLGTITFLTSNNEFGALGHGIHDTDTSVLLEISDGAIYKTSIHSIRKGQNGIPGSMEGIIVYNSYNKLGKIDYNCDLGIYGTVEKVEELFSSQEAVPVATKEEIEIGPATIRCFVDNNVEEYDIMVTNIDESRRDANKGLVIEVTDSDLLEKTGGIIQGMSGSPILQNGKMIGAVTHVFVQDSTKGYGIFIENMLKNVASNRLSNE